MFCSATDNDQHKSVGSLVFESIRITHWQTAGYMHSGNVWRDVTRLLTRNNLTVQENRTWMGGFCDTPKNLFSSSRWTHLLSFSFLLPSSSLSETGVLRFAFSRHFSVLLRMCVLLSVVQQRVYEHKMGLEISYRICNAPLMVCVFTLTRLDKTEMRCHTAVSQTYALTRV